MKLFEKYEAIKFQEENMIFITNDEYLYYVYNIDRKSWEKYRNAGYDKLTVPNYPDVSREELTEAMGGIFPQKKTDFTRLCYPAQLSIGEMLDLLKEDYAKYMSDCIIYNTIHVFLLKSNIVHKSFERIRKLLDTASKRKNSKKRVLAQIKNLTFTILGRDIFKREIGIDDGHNSSSYFWIMPVRVIDESDTNAMYNVAEMESAEISIEETDVFEYLSPFLFKYYDDELKANRQRVSCFAPDGFVRGFEWNLTHNFYTHESMTALLVDIKDTVSALSSGKENEFTEDLLRKTSRDAYWQKHLQIPDEKKLTAFQKNNPTKCRIEIDALLDFYDRFLYRMEYMIRVGQEKGYDLISVMGP